VQLASRQLGNEKFKVIKSEKKSNRKVHLPWREYVSVGIGVKATRLT